MAIAQDIIEAAYNRSTANNAGKLAQDPELILHLNRVYLRFYTLAARQRPADFETRTFLTLMGNPATAVMAPRPIDVLYVQNDAGQEVNLISGTERNRLWHMAPCIYQEGARLTSRAKPGDPVSCDILELTVLDAPVSLTTLATPIDPRFHERLHQLLIDAVAMYLATKDDSRGAADVTKLEKDYLKELAAFAAEYDIAPEALQWAHAPVKRKPAVGGSAA